MPILRAWHVQVMRAEATDPDVCTFAWGVLLDGVQLKKVGVCRNGEYHRGVCILV